MKKPLINFLLVIMGSTSLLANASTARQQESETQTKILLGKTLTNPYSVNHMRKAFTEFNKRIPNSPLANKRLLLGTHRYIQINPSNEEHLAQMNSLDGAADGEIVLHDYPLDREILNDGDYFVEPQNESDLYHPVYTVIPMGYVLPEGLPYTQLDTLYKPADEEEGVESIALELAGWGNEEDCSGSRVTCEIEMKADSQAPEQKGLFGRRYRPHGYIKIENSESRTLEPLRQAKISIGRGVWWRYVHTDNNGYFRSPKKYRGKVRIRAKWRSNIATIRKSWNEMLGIQVSDHLMTLRRSINGRTKEIRPGEEHIWYKGTVHNGLVKYNDFATANGIDRLVSDANIWVWKNGRNSGSAPMLKHFRLLPTVASIAGIGQSDLWEAFVSYHASMLINLVPRRLRPDMIFSGLKNRKKIRGRVNTLEIEQLVFHEAAHYSHAKQAGLWYWAKMVSATLSNMITKGDPYVDGSEPSFKAAKQIALVEGWARLIEIKAMLQLYRKADVDAYGTWTYEAEAIRRMENFRHYTVPMRYSTGDAKHWFLQGLFWDILDDSTLETFSGLRSGQTNLPVDNLYSGSIVDEVSLQHPKMLKPLFQLLKSDVYTACDLGAKLVNQNPVDGPELETLFHSYGFTCVDGGDGLETPAVPSYFYIQNTSGSVKQLQWNSVSAASYYEVYKNNGSSISAPFYYFSRVSAPASSKSVRLGQSAYFKVRACNAAGCSSYTPTRFARYQNDGCRDVPFPMEAELGVESPSRQLIDCPIE